MTTQSERAGPLTSSFRPCILVSETHHPFLGAVGVFANALERIARDGFYGAAGIAGVPDGGERRQIADIVTTSGMSLTYWTSFVLAAQHLNLSALDPELRARSVSTIKRQMDDAMECGASALGVLSGPDPGPAARPAALEALCDSLRELATAGAHRLTVVIEPLDREIHKKGLLGPMSDSVAVLDKV
ncbi:MAG: TIM barrel protein, partial [Planctomycetes bacterium]|nr:TIM barrel protein [Planctomycetota bacterium]